MAEVLSDPSPNVPKVDGTVEVLRFATPAPTAASGCNGCADRSGSLASGAWEGDGSLLK